MFATHRHFLIVFGIICLLLGVRGAAAVPVNAPIVINEIMVSNASAELDTEFTNFSDWIELYNTTASGINISGYYLSDDPLNTQMWTFPTGTTIPAGGFLRVWADSENTGLHTNFKLKASGEVITLSTAAGVVVDVLDYNGIPQLPNVAYGRATNGGSAWVYYDMGQATPGASNNNGVGVPDVGLQAAEPVPNIAGGYYSTTPNILFAPSTAAIYYTLNGSEPTTAATLYTGNPIPITATTVLRARAYESGRLASPITTQTYFINESFTLPVISIATNDEYFFDHNIGIYVPGVNAVGGDIWTGNYFQKWERPISFEYYDADQNFQFHFNGGVEIHGNFSRTLRQKGLEIITGGQYGSDDVRYQLFDEKEIDRFERFLLRASGGDQYTTFFRDAMMHRLVAGQMDMDYQAYQPTIVFLNGQYWGIHNMREKIGADYIKRNHGYDEEEIDLLNRRGTASTDIIIGTNDDYKTLIAFIENNNMATQANYEWVKSQMDVDQFINYWLTEIYFDNRDWPNNNIRYWRPHVGQWRWLLFDLDEGFGFRDSGDWTCNTVRIATQSNQTKCNGSDTVSSWATLIVRRLLANTEFRNEFVQRFAAHMSITFEPTRVVGIIDEMQDVLEPEMPAHIVKWRDYDGFNGIQDMARWENRVQRMRDFGLNRRDVVYTHLINRFTQVTGTNNLTLVTSGPEMGHILVHDVQVPESPFVGRFFTNIPIRLQAVAEPGYRFVEWRRNGAVVSTNLTYVTTINNNTTTVTAVFAPLPAVVINEIHYNPAASQGPDDIYEFIELYNHHHSPVDLSGYYLEGVVYTFTVGTVIAPGQYIVLAQTGATYEGQGYTVFQWHSGGLNNTGETLRLYTPEGYIVDEVSYQDSPPWPTEPDGDGSSLELRHPALNNNLASSWMASFAFGGTPGRHNDDDNPLINNSPTRFLTEGDEGLTAYPVTVTLSGMSGLTVTVAYATLDGTAVANVDYLPQTGTLIFPPETTSQTITLQLLGNERYEGNRTFTLLLSNPHKGRMGTAAALMVIVDDDPLPTLSMSNLTVAEGIGTAVLTATLTNASAFPVTVDYATADGTATAGEDYLPVSGTLTFPANATTQTIAIEIIDDTLYEPEETFLVNLSHISNAFLATSQVTVTIVSDDDPPRWLNVVGSSVLEGDVGQIMLPFTVTLSLASSQPITVDYATADGTATAGTDYLPVSGTLTFAPGETVKVVEVPVLGDTIYELDETFALVLSDPQGADLETAVATGVILNDDAAPLLDIIGSEVWEGNAGHTMAPFTITLSAASDVTFTVAYATADGTAVAGSDYLPVSGTLTFAPGETVKVVEVPVIGDTIYEVDETFYLNGLQSITLHTAQGVAVILNDDPEPSVSIVGSEVLEGDVGQKMATFTITLSAVSTVTVTFDYTTANGTAEVGLDYLPVTGTLTFAPSETIKTVQVPILGDTLYELDESVYLLALVEGDVSMAQGTTLILNDDLAPLVDVVGNNVQEGDVGQAMATFTITLSAPSAVAGTLEYATADGTAIAGVDYTAVSGSLTFAPYETIHIVQVPVLSNETPQPNRSFWMVLSNLNHLSPGTLTAEAVIVDDDATAPATYTVLLPLITR